jgi:ceramide glucosyltransferase
VNFLEATLAVLAALSLALAFWQWLAACRFPLHRRVADPSFAPPVTLLKPLKGCDATTPASLQSWFTQNYPGPVQILFGVVDAADPVCPVVRELIEKKPGGDAQLVVCAEPLGANGKVSTLAQLERLAKHDLILVSDADVRVPPDFLANIVAPLRDEGRAGSPLPAEGANAKDGAHGVPRPTTVGLVSCFYRLANPATTAMRCEAVAVNADFWSQVLQAAGLKPLDFALGAAMLTRRRLLGEIGGFNALVNCLADDYQLGHRLAQRGHRLTLCPVVVECWDVPQNWRGVWKHQLRWARTIRACQPAPYFFSILSNATLWPLLWLAVSLARSAPFYLPLFAIAVLLARVVLAQNLQRRFVPARGDVAPFWLVPVKDLLHAAIWAGAFLGNTVEWRGQKMRLRRDGTLIAGSEASADADLR